MECHMFFIRKADQNDASDIAHIHFESWSATYSNLLPETYKNKENNLSQKMEMWGKLLPSPGVNTWIAYDTENTTVGFISYFKKDHECEITTLYLLPQFQNLGIGTKLINAALIDAFQCNICSSLSLWVLQTNLSAISFYKKFGFESDSQFHEELYEGIKITDVRMIKSL